MLGGLGAVGPTRNTKGPFRPGAAKLLLVQKRAMNREVGEGEGGGWAGEIPALFGQSCPCLKPASFCFSNLNSHLVFF